ncbi:MAG: ABC transporter ATP-binding protein [Promethearchaeota archaeon]
MQKKSKIINEPPEVSKTANSEEYAIIVDNIWKTYKIPIERHYKLHQQITSLITRRNRGYRYIEVFKGISFKVRKGETLGIIGDNGTGKTTLLKILAGIIFPDKGVVDVRGKILPIIGLGVGFDYSFKAEENIFLYGTLLGLPHQQIKEKIPEIFEFSGLNEFRGMKFRNYSSGMKLRLAFAVAIQCDPDIFLFDEVIAVGDQNFKEKCFEKIDNYIQRKKTIVLVSHGLFMIKKICKHAIWLNEGKIASYGKSEKVIEDYKEYGNKKGKLPVKKEKSVAIEKIKG